jgi:hypothetical protein
VRARLDDLRRRLPAVEPRTAIAWSLLVLAIPIAFVLVTPHPLEQPFGVDFQLYRDVTLRWLHGGPFFEPRQLAGPYEIAPGDVLYPPVAIWLFAPFAILGGGPSPTFAALLWWAIPLGLVAWAVWRLRPAPWTWPLLALCATNPTVPLKLWTGNPVIWSMAALALAIALPWRTAAPFVLLKPSLAPFALFGIPRRSWWVGAAVLALMSLPFGSLWADWLTTLVNSRGGGLLYSSLEAPFLVLPLVAWLGRTRDPGRSVPAVSRATPPRRSGPGPRDAA